MLAINFPITFHDACVAALAALVTWVAAAGGAGAVLPPTNGGAPDPTFGTGGSGAVLFDYGSNYDYGQQIIIQPDGKYLISGYGSNLGANLGIGFVARHQHDGSFDTGFNGTGRRVFGDDNVGACVLRTLLQSDGKILVIGCDYVPAGTGTVRGLITRLNADGSVDAGFGSGGVVRMSGSALPWLYFRSAALLPDGRLIVAGTEVNVAFTDIRPFTLRLLANGQPDPSYAAGGLSSFNDLAPGLRPDRAALQASGKLTLTGRSQVPGSSPPAFRAVVVRLNADGSTDSEFAAGGKFVYTYPGVDSQIEDLLLDADGTVTAVGEGYGSSGASFALRLLPNGQLDPSFGTQGVVSLPATVGSAGAAMRPDRKLVIAGSRQGTANYETVVLRLLPDGTLDGGFGTGGITEQSFGYGLSYAQGVAIDVDSKIVVAGTGLSAVGTADTMLARLIGVEVTTNAVEFQNSILNHYFITADPNESTAIDGGSAGPGWSRTGQTWKSGGPNRVCRFYGVQAAGGPNGHFYTIDSDECAAVQLDPGWHFESYDFSGWPVKSSGVCPAGTIPVKRAYNGRFAQHDSTHRYTTSDTIYNQMVTQGWSGEGVVFCSVQ